MRCPYCAEDITDDDATRCPHCGSELPTASGRSPAPPPAGWGGWGEGSGGSPDPARSGSAESPTQPATRETVQFSHTGQRYLLGYDSTHFGIWDRSSPTAPVERFPRSDDGWSEAWARYASLEPHSQPVQAGPPQGSPYGGPGPASPTVPWQQGPPAYYLPQQQRTNGLAVASLVLGIVGVLVALLAIPEILALIFGLVALGQIRRSSGTLGGRGLAIAGVSLGGVGIALFVIVVISLATNNHSSPGF
ncbi:MAG: DUF4190 domain-containing protein [Actinomycetota bacterium]